MIFDITYSALILGAVMIIAFCLVEYFLAFSDQADCDHCFAEFQSTGTRKCIDCGHEETIRKPHYPKHQR